MVIRSVILSLLFFCSGVTFAQSGGSTEKSALKLMERGQWEKAEMKLRKVLARDTLHPSARHLLSVLYFSEGNPAYNIDSAYRYAVRALEDYTLAPSRMRERLKKASVDSLVLVSLRARIDSTAFEEARSANTEEAYRAFLSEFPSAVQRDLATRLRDEVAFQAALRENTARAFLSYLTRYPQAERAQEARAHYDRLLYLGETSDGRLTSFERFLSNFPETPYREEVMRHIFEISTASGAAESYLSFISKYRGSSYARRAEKMLFHLLAEEDNPQWPPGFLNDSLQNVLRLSRSFLVPVLRNGLYGFMDEHGNELMAPAYKTIPADYLCGQITDEVLMLDSKLIARSGSVVYDGAFGEAEDMGLGFLKITVGEQVNIAHKAGFIVHDSLRDARVIGGRYLAILKDQGWLLSTLTGRLLDTTSWDDISALEDVIVFRKDGKLLMALEGEPARSAEGVALHVSEPFDEIRQWSDRRVWGKAGDYEGVFDQRLHRVIGFDRHQLEQTYFGALGTHPTGYTLYNREGRKSTLFKQVKIFGARVIVKKGGAWTVFDPLAMETRSRSYDTLRSEGPFLVGMAGDTVYVHFGNESILPFFKPVRVSFIAGIDSTSFLLVELKAGTRTVYNLAGRALFSGTFDALEYAGGGIFVMTRRERKGLVDAAGKVLLPTEYDAIASARDGVLSLLKNKRFGAWHIGRKQLLRPQYDRNILPYSQTIVTTFKDGHYGFLGWDNKSMSPFAFDEVTYWNDSTALVRKGSFWELYDIYGRKSRQGSLRNIFMVKNGPGEKTAIVQKDNYFGVISNRRDVLIPITFSDVKNLGSADHPLYFTEKHIREASLFVVIYYDDAGNMIRKEIYDDAAGYDRIYCSDN